MTTSIRLATIWRHGNLLVGKRGFVALALALLMLNGCSEPDDSTDSTSLTEETLRKTAREVESLKRQRRFGEAFSLQSDLVNEVTTHFGPRDANTAIQKMNLAWLHQELGRYEAAEGLLLEALDVLSEQFGSQHRYVAIAQGNLADLYKVMGTHNRVARRSDKTAPSLSAEETYNRLRSEALDEYERAQSFAESQTERDVMRTPPNYGHQESDLFRARTDLGRQLDVRRQTHQAALSKSLTLFEKTLAVADGSWEESDARVQRVLHDIAGKFTKSYPEIANQAQLRIDLLRTMNAWQSCREEHGDQNTATHSFARKAIKAHLAFAHRWHSRYERMVKDDPNVRDETLVEETRRSWRALRVAIDLLEEYRPFAEASVGWEQQQTWATEYWRAAAVLSVIKSRSSGGSDEAFRERIQNIDIIAQAEREVIIACGEAACTAAKLMAASIDNRMRGYDPSRGDRILRDARRDHYEFLGYAQSWLFHASPHGTDEQRQRWRTCQEQVGQIRQKYKQEGMDKYMSPLYRVARYHGLFNFDSQ